MLAEELSAINYKADSTYTLREEIKELELLILELRNENEQAQRVGMGEIDRMSSDRVRF